VPFVISRYANARAFSLAILAASRLGGVMQNLRVYLRIVRPRLVAVKVK
jgi:hypothetical protein